MSEQTDATDDRPDDDELPRDDREGEGEDREQDAPQPWAKTSSGDAD